MSLFDPVPDVLDVTLRDGSYVHDFQFTAEDTANLVAALESCGFRWIEVGHGLGLSASDRGRRRAAASDVETLEAAAGAVRSARWGMFLIPGIGREEDLRLAARHGMSFVRIGANVTEPEVARPFLELGKELGLVVAFNAMKSYAVPADELARIAARVRGWGADVFYLVDSAGTLVPEDVAGRIAAIQAESDVPVGFHGHDNLSLAVANTLQAAESGAVLLDASLRGIGRSAGNAITEAVVATCKRRGWLPHVDLKRTLDVSAGWIEPLAPRRGLDTLALISGYAGFHSSFTAPVQAAADHHGVDVRDVIVRLCEEDRVDAPPELIERICRELASVPGPEDAALPARPRRVTREETFTLEGLLGRIYAQARKAERQAVLNVVASERPLDAFVLSTHVHDARRYSVGSVTLSSESQLETVLQEADGAVDIVLLDVDRRLGGLERAAALARGWLKESLLLTYSDSRAWVDALREQVVHLLSADLRGAGVVVAGDHPRSRALALQLAEGGAEVALLGDEGPPELSEDALPSLSVGGGAAVRSLDPRDDAARKRLATARAVVVWPRESPWFDESWVEPLRPGAFLLDAGIHSIPPAALDAAMRSGVLPVRVNIWPVLGGVLTAAHEASQAFSESFGWDEIAGVPVVAGSAIGRHGAVIVDSVRQPTRVIGVADGRGGRLAKPGAPERDGVLRVQEEINRRRVLPKT